MENAPGYCERCDQRVLAVKNTHRIRNMITGAVALVGGSVLAGCGGGTASTSSPARSVTVTRTQAADTATPMTRAEFIAAGDAICRSSDTAVEGFKRRIKAVEGESSATGAERVALILRQAVASERASLAKLQVLPAPPRDAATITKWLTAESESVTDQSNLANAVANQETAAREAAEQAVRRAKALAHRIAQGYGFKVCGAEE